MPAMSKGTRSRRSTRGGKRIGLEGTPDEALRILFDDDMMRSIARIGRFRVLAHEMVVAAPPDPLAGHRLALIDLVDYSNDRNVHACVDLDRGGVASLRCAPAEPLAPEEQAEALSVALADRRVADGIALGDMPQAILHVGARRGHDVGHAHRSAAVLFGPCGPSHKPSLVAIVDLARSVVTRLVPPEAL